MTLDELVWTVNHPTDYGRSVRMWLHSKDRARVMPPFVAMAPVAADGDRDVPPTLHLNIRSAQSLFDALWEAGFRPVNNPESPHAVKALNDHLQDMRMLVSHYVAVDLQGSPRAKS